MNDERVLEYARDMGKVLQLVNIARDIVTDSETLGRCYVPYEYLKDARNELRILKNERHASTINEHQLHSYSLRLLQLAETFNSNVIKGISCLPHDVQRQLLVLYHIYKSIGIKIKQSTQYKQRIYLNTFQRILIAFKYLYFHLN
ncbi:carotenoid synthase-carotenoid cyclase-like protein [Leptotrombidium deliense]|uniref:15-cis-phytoene synthase n=1 Tax=Leptotrombidium deliense TaxID=299467 RepID=A0A443SE06_9ACAR|nr:carotenoid synthase-carotenoid cyclase-like protein [Leptotrombidium deliense]